MKVKNLAVTFLAAIVGTFSLAGIAACSGNEEEEGSELVLGGWNDFTYTYTGTDGETTMNCSLYLPSSYDGETELPLITYVPDANYSGTRNMVPQTKKGECPSNWLSLMEENPAMMLIFSFSGSSDPSDELSEMGQVVPIIKSVIGEYAVDTDRLYLTGHSMGGILDFQLNYYYPEMFAATVYVGCQAGSSTTDDIYYEIMESGMYASQKLIYIASALDPQAPVGQQAMMDYLDEHGISYGYDFTLEALGDGAIEQSNEKVLAVLNEGYNINIFQFTHVTSSAEQGSSQEHMKSFEYAYELEAIFDWLMEQELS